LLLSLRVKKSLKSVNIWQSYKQERGCLTHLAPLANTLKKTKKVKENEIGQNFGEFLAHPVHRVTVA